jgi:hypothetical protein
VTEQIEQTNPAEVERLQATIRDLRERLEQAESMLLAERFKGVPHYNRGDIVLVPRKLFGNVRWWPARIDGVHFRYSSGEDASGNPWERHSVSYSVFYRQADGTFGGASQGYYHSEVQDAPAEDSRADGSGK